MGRWQCVTRRGFRFGYFRAGGVLQSRRANPSYLVDSERDDLEMRFDRFAERRKPHGRSALEQCAAQFLLELANGHRKRGLGNAADRGGAGKSSCSANCEEISDLPQVHGLPSAAIDLLLRAVVMGRSRRRTGSPANRDFQSSNACSVAYPDSNRPGARALMKAIPAPATREAKNCAAIRQAKARRSAQRDGEQRHTPNPPESGAW